MSVYLKLVVFGIHNQFHLLVQLIQFDIVLLLVLFQTPFKIQNFIISEYNDFNLIILNKIFTFALILQKKELLATGDPNWRIQQGDTAQARHSFH